MAAKIPTNKIDGVTVNGKRSVDTTVPVLAAADTIAYTQVGLTTVDEIWVRADPGTFTVNNTTKAITSVGAVTAGSVFRIVGS